MTRSRNRTLVDELASLKAQRVPWDAAWQFATAGRPGHFKPTALDDGTTHPCGAKAGSPHNCRGYEAARNGHYETLARFEYRTLRAAYLGVGPAVAFDRDLGDDDRAVGYQSTYEAHRGRVAA